MPKTIKEDGLKSVLPIISKEIKLVDAAKKMNEKEAEIMQKIHPKKLEKIMSQ